MKGGIIMFVFVIEGLLVVISAIYYILSKNPEWLILVGLILLAMAIERLISSINDMEFSFETSGDIEIFTEDMEWIRTDKALPPEPQVKFKEYNVITENCKDATTLLYKGKGEWADPYGDARYKVRLWRYMPEPPKEDTT